MSTITKVDVSKHKQQKELNEKKVKIDEKVEQKRDMKFRVKAMKQPMNQSSQPMSAPMYEPTEYKIAPSLMLIEAVARGLPNIAPADYDRMKMRLLRSPDIQHLTEKVFMDYTVESDKLKLILTIMTHCANEVLTEATQHHKKKELMSQSMESNNLKPQQTTSSDQPILISLEAPERMELPSA